ncbi:MAG: hypothetical protein FWE81_05940 [Rikenellaceae bacterium]|nr:hypothetical protein [Rikenellaceae bacterium]
MPENIGYYRRSYLVWVGRFVPMRYGTTTCRTSLSVSRYSGYGDTLPSFGSKIA